MSMSTGTAQTVIVTTGLGVMALSVIQSAQAGTKPPTTRVLGAALATVGLSAFANVAPEIAGPVALLWGLSALMVTGAPALSAVKNATSTKPPTRTTTGPRVVYV
jgi:hypothetical protein